jgi:putative DNA primase/helicase
MVAEATDRRDSQPLENDQPLTLASAFLDAHGTDECGAPILWHWRGNFYEFRKSVYIKLVAEELLAHVQSFLALQKIRGKKGPIPYSVTAHRVREVIQLMQALRQAMIEEMPSWLGRRARINPKDVITFNNGLIDIQGYMKGDGALIPPTPAWLSENVLPYNFRRDADCPNWIAFLEDIFDGDEQCIALLQEWFGYCLTSDTSFHKTMFLIGPPRSGKGTICRQLSETVGAANCASPRLSTLCEPFGLQCLLGKTVAICPDAHLGRNTDSVGVVEVIKSISGEDAIDVARKHMETLTSVRLPIRFTIALNEFPYLPDASVAMRSRLLLLPLNKSYAGKEDRRLEDRLRSETPGVIVWAMNGLKALRESGRFTEPAVSVQQIEEFARLSSPTLAFIEDCCEVGPAQEVEVDSIWDAWKKWCDANGVRLVPKSSLGSHLKSVVPGLKKVRRKEEGSRYHTYAGITLKALLPFN